MIRKLLITGGLLLSAGLAQAEIGWIGGPWKQTGSTVTITNKDVRIATTTGNRGIIFQDGTVLISTRGFINPGPIYLRDLVDVNPSSPTLNDALRYNGAQWVPTSAGAGDVILTATQTHTGAKTFNSYTVFNGSVTVSSNVNVSGTVTGGTFSGSGASLTGIANSALDSSSVTKRGNTFNAANKLLQLDTSTKVPNALLDSSSVTLYGASIPNAAIDSSSVTKQGNTFNASSKLLQLDVSTKIPNALLDYSSVTMYGAAIPAASVAAGNLVAGVKITTTNVNALGASATTYWRGDNVWTGVNPGLTAGDTTTWTAPNTWASSATFQNGSFSVGGSTLIVTGGKVGIGGTPTAEFTITGPDETTGFRLTPAAGKGFAIVSQTNEGAPAWIDSTAPWFRINDNGAFVFVPGSGGDMYFNYDLKATRSTYFDGAEHHNLYDRTKSATFYGNVAIGEAGTPKTLAVNSTFSVATSTLSVTGGNVGIGVASPSYRLQVGTSTSGYAYFGNDGTFGLYGTGTVWDDLRVEPTVRGTGSNNPGFEKWFDDAGLAIVSAAGTSRGTFLYSFSDELTASEKEVFFTAQLPHSWAGTAVGIHVHWVGSHMDTTAAPVWGLEYNWREIGAQFSTSSIVYTDGKNYTGDATFDTNITSGTHYLSIFSSLSPTTSQDGISSVLVGRLFRFSGNVSDTYDVSSNKCGLLYIDIHYEINSLGSNTEYTK